MPVLHVTPRLRTLAFACKDKSCAPPPVGTGGSNPVGGSASAVFKSALERSLELKDFDRWTLDNYSKMSFSSVNRFLRTGEPASAAGDVEAMDDVFRSSAAVRIDTPVTVFRGRTMSVEELSAHPVEFTDNGFVSTTADAGQALSFSHASMQSPGKIGVVYTVRLPKGATVVAGTAKSDWGNGPEYREQELILNRGSRFRVVGTPRIERRVVDGRSVDVGHVDVEVVQ